MVQQPTCILFLHFQCITNSISCWGVKYTLTRGAQYSVHLNLHPKKNIVILHIHNNVLNQMHDQFISSLFFSYQCALAYSSNFLTHSVLAEEYRVSRPLYESKAREKTKQFAQQSWEDMRKVGAALSLKISHFQQPNIFSNIQLCIGDTEDADAPDQLVCPLTSKLFQDPVMTMFGHTYERKALLDHLAKNNNQDPIAKKEVDPNALFPNKTVLELVRKYQANMCRKVT